MAACGVSQWIFNVDAFRVQFVEFADAAAFPTLTLQSYFDAAGCYVENKNYGWLRGCCNLLALNLMTAHFAKLASAIADGQTTGIETAATIDKVSVTMMAPPVKGMWQYWLAQTPYGQQLLALLSAKAAGGLYTPGSIGRAGFGGGAILGGYGRYNGGRGW